MKSLSGRQNYYILNKFNNILIKGEYVRERLKHFIQDDTSYQELLNLKKDKQALFIKEEERVNRF